SDVVVAPPLGHVPSLGHVLPIIAVSAKVDPWGLPDLGEPLHSAQELLHLATLTHCGTVHLERLLAPRGHAEAIPGQVGIALTHSFDRLDDVCCHYWPSCRSIHASKVLMRAQSTEPIRKC